MKVGCPKEVKNNEYRVGLIPAAAHSYVAAGHEVFIEKGAGLGSNITDEEYKTAGAKILDTAKQVWDSSEMIVKVKEPLPQEYDLMKPEQLIYTYFHFAADEKLTKACLDKKIIALAYETVEESNGSLPLLKPMSEVAGRMSVLMGSYFLAKPSGGIGLLPTGVPGVPPANIVVVGGGVVGTNAAKVAAGLGAKVSIFDVNLDRLGYLETTMPANVFPIYSDPLALEAAFREANIIVGAVLIPGARAPKLIKKEHLKIMKPGTVIVDVAIDQGGCCETSHATTHDDPVFVIDGIIHYCVANMPGAFARTATFSLNNYTIRYGMQLAQKGVEKACRENSAILKGLNMYKGKITYRGVAEAFGMPYVPAEDVVK